MLSKTIFDDYSKRLQAILADYDWKPVEKLAEDLGKCWDQQRQVFFCGNGGSAANAVHLANDFIYGVASQIAKPGIRVEALPANTAVLTCLANDISYEEIFAEQLRVKGQKGDMLIALSGSGNSENIIRAIRAANDLGMHSNAILGFSGGECANLAQSVIHFPIDDMQIAEDLQLIVGHMCMQYLARREV